MAAIRGAAIALGFILLLWTVAVQGAENINIDSGGKGALPGGEKVEASVLLELRDNEGGIHAPGEPIPPIHSGEDRGWRKLENITISRNEMDKVNHMNEPNVAINRLDDRITIDGRERLQDTHNETGGGVYYLYAKRDRYDEEPDVSLSGNGSGRVRFPNKCVVYYNKGHRKEETRECSSSQVRRADKLVADYRRQWDRDRGYSGYHGDYSTPVVSMSGDGSGRVRFKNDCTVYYDAKGRRIRELSSCSRSQAQRADEEMARYRHENDIGGGGN